MECDGFEKRQKEDRHDDPHLLALLRLDPAKQSRYTYTDN
jgi:hypothetical protein